MSIDWFNWPNVWSWLCAIGFFVLGLAVDRLPSLIVPRPSCEAETLLAPDVEPGALEELTCYGDPEPPAAIANGPEFDC